MSIAEIKEELIAEFAKKIDHIEDEASLNVILEFLNGIQTSSSSEINLARHYAEIKQKYSSVLAKLAQ